MAYKRILTVQDISCIGQCSMTVALPVLSACGHEVCILPSAVLSTHTGGFGAPVVQKLTDGMGQTVSHWKENGIDFDLIYIGYLGSLEAVAYAEEIISSMLAPGGTVVVDPAMADHGKLYRGLDETYAEAMTQLCRRADVMLPNVTEAAMMAGLPYREDLDAEYIAQLMERLEGRDVLLTGVGFSEDQTGFAIRKDGSIQFSHHRRLEKSYHGTGDLFASAFVGALASGKDMLRAGQIAAEFTLRSIENTFRNPAHWYGVKFETALPELIRLLNET